MNRYLVRLCFQVTGPGLPIAQFDEQYRLVIAEDRQAALVKAGLLGETEAGAVISPSYPACEWQFAGVADIFDIDSAGDGALLFSGTVCEEAQSYLSYLRLRHKEIQLKTLTFA